MDVKVPDIGDFTDVPVIELLVAVGDEVAAEDPLVALESDKATMEVPAPAAGKVKELKVAVGDRVSEGTVILVLEAAEAPAEESGGAGSGRGAESGDAGSGGEAKSGDAGSGGGADSGDAGSGGEADSGGGATSGGGAESGSDGKSSAGATAAKSAGPPPDADVSVQVAVLGGGPGGYTAAFRAADLGLSVALIDRGDVLGGVCLNVGCIPSKALLHVARVLAEAEELGDAGVSFGEPQIDIDKVRAWKEGVVKRLTGGLESLAKQRKVQVVRGEGQFTGPNTITVAASPGGLASGSNRPEDDSPAPPDTTVVGFESCIVAAGSEAARLPNLPDDKRIMDSSGALDVEDIPERLLVIGGGIIGLEMATVYDALGSKVTVVELLDQLIPGCDKDLVKVLHKRVKGRYEAIHLSTKVESVEASDDGLKVTFGDQTEVFDRILVAVGRRPNGGRIGADAAGIAVDERGFIGVDAQLRTNVGHIHAIGDIAGEPMLAHKASHEGKLAAEAIAGHDVSWDVRSIPSVAYTDPEVAWTGLTETEAKASGIEYQAASFPWAASGRALSMGRSDGLTKLLVDPETHRVLGAGIVGINAGELLAEAVLAIEAGADAEDIALTIHPHPTLSETIGFAAELVEGTITDIMPKRARR